MTNPIVLASAPEFYSWQAQDGTMRVHLNIAAVAQMQADVQSGLKRIPKRGAEVGGILLGSAEQIANVRTITVHHFQSFECEYSTGPSWTLSPRDLSLLEPILHALGRANDAEQRIVGFYRSNTRERLALSTADLDLIGKYFPEDRHIFLLIQPQLGRTASLEFSYWAGGQVCSAPNQLPIRATLGAFATSALPGTVRKSVPPAAEPAVQPAELPVRPAPAEARIESPQQPLTLADTRPAQP